MISWVSTWCFFFQSSFIFLCDVCECVCLCCVWGVAFVWIQRYRGPRWTAHIDFQALSTVFLWRSVSGIGVIAIILCWKANESNDCVCLYFHSTCFTHSAQAMPSIVSVRTVFQLRASCQHGKQCNDWVILYSPSPHHLFNSPLYTTFLSYSDNS